MNYTLIMSIIDSSGDKSEVNYTVSKDVVHVLVDLFSRLNSLHSELDYIPWFSIGIEYEIDQQASKEVYGDLFLEEEWELLCEYLPNIPYGYDSISNVRIVETTEYWKLTN